MYFICTVKGVSTGIDFRYETVPVQLRTSRPSRVAQPDGDSGEDLVPKSTQQMETPIGRRTGSGQYGGQHGGGRGCGTSAHRPRADPLPREQRGDEQHQFDSERVIQHDLFRLIFVVGSSSASSDWSQHAHQRDAQFMRPQRPGELQQQQKPIIAAAIAATTTTTATTKRQ